MTPLSDWAWWQWALLLGVVGPLAMVICAFLGVVLYFFLDLPPRCPTPTCGERLPAYYRGERYAGEKCPACTVRAAVAKGAAR